MTLIVQNNRRHHGALSEQLRRWSAHIFEPNIGIAETLPMRPRPILLILLTAVALLIATPARAENQGSATFGHGFLPCARWLAALNGPETESVGEFALRLTLREGGMAWVHGYVAASAPRLKNAASITPAFVEWWISAWCGAHPQETMADAAAAFVVMDMEIAGK